MSDVNILLAKNAGFCFGVKRAVDIVEKLQKSGEKQIFTIGELIHNQTFLDRLSKKGIRTISEDEIESAACSFPDAVFVIRTHGISKKITDFLEKSHIKYVDATCPYVKKIHKIVDENSDENTDLVIVGDRCHPEVIGIQSYAKGNVFIFSDEKQIDEELEKPSKKRTFSAIVVSQTTFNYKKYKICQKNIAKLYTNPKIFDTICNVTENRQTEARHLAANSDVMIVLGGMQSSNSKKLFDICKNVCPDTYFAQTSADIPFDDIVRKSRDKSCKTFTAGITAGASTPDDIIEEVKIRMTNSIELNSDAQKIEEKPVINDSMTFEEMFNASYKVIRAGERVQGVITSVTSTEIHVDLGIKQTGIIPYSEVSDDPSVQIENEFKVGDTIDVVVVKFNDAEGTVLLSKKRLDIDKNWNALKDAYENGTILTGKVCDVVKGGVIFQSGPHRAFIPASQTSLPRTSQAITEKDLESLLGKEGKIKLIDINPQRKRAVGSMKVVIREERKALQDKFWESAEIGKKYTGTVKSLTSYGAFVDLGGVDGMIHITELSWKHIKNPAEVVKVGDTVEVFIKDLDPEKKRVSLGYKTEETNPWTIFNSKYSVGDTVDVKIVSLMPFGAFAEIIPGVDGLIHISQICEQKIQKPADVLNIGETVSAKIIDINDENHKISLSIKALLVPEETAEEVSDSDNVTTEAE